MTKAVNKYTNILRKMMEKEQFFPYRFNKENVNCTKSIIGRGQFTISFMLGRIELEDDGTVSALMGHPHINTPVLIKSVNIDDEEKCFKALVRELNILEDLRPQPNILKLVGTCTNELKNREIYLAFEFCVHGNLLKFLRRCNPLAEFDTSRTIITHTEGGPVLTLTRHRLLEWSHEIASGMEYLASKQIMHNDLAARNILVTSVWKTKICNFALAQKFSARSAPHNLPKIVLPLKWMSPEAIKSLKYSEKSDVWSFGVTLWEIYTIGDIPYRDIDVDSNFWKDLLQGVRLNAPQYANSNVWSVMNSCWGFDPERRPRFADIRYSIRKLLQAYEERVVNEIPQNRALNTSKLNLPSMSVSMTINHHR